jgi:hypothetical protein
VITCRFGPVPTWKARAVPAALKEALPAWVAVIVQAPAPTAVAQPVVVGPTVVVRPETVHTAGVSDRNATGSPDDVLALRATRAPACAAGGWVKLTLCGPVPVPI